MTFAGKLTRPLVLLFAIAFAVPPAQATLAIPAGYFVRANMSGGGLSIDDATSISGLNVGALGSVGFGTADLATGTLSGFADGNDPSNTARSFLDFGDTITVLGLLVPTTITLEMRVVGNFGGTPAAALAMLRAADSLLCDDGACFTSVGIVDSDTGIWDGTTSSSSVDRTLSVSRLLDPGDSTFSFLAQLINYASGPSGVSDFRATMSLVLPDGVTFRSSSGVFLRPPSEVPEPGSLLLSAFGVLALAARRASRRTARR